VASGTAIAICYALARRNQETIASVGLTLMLSADFLIPALINYGQGDDFSNLTIASAIVVFMAGDLLGQYALLAVAGLTALILLVAEDQLFRVGVGTTLTAYLAISTALYYHRHQTERSQAAQADFEQRRPRGRLGRYDHRDGYVRLRLDTRRGERLQVRVEPKYFDQLELTNGEEIIIDRYEVRSDNGQTYIQALSITKL